MWRAWQQGCLALHFSVYNKEVLPQGVQYGWVVRPAEGLNLLPSHVRPFGQGSVVSHFPLPICIRGPEACTPSAFVRNSLQQGGTAAKDDLISKTNARVPLSKGKKRDKNTWLFTGAAHMKEGSG